MKTNLRIQHSMASNVRTTLLLLESNPCSFSASLLCDSCSCNLNNCA
jgi:hypothetical protein